MKQVQSRRTITSFKKDVCYMYTGAHKLPTVWWYS